MVTILNVDMFFRNYQKIYCNYSSKTKASKTPNYFSNRLTLGTKRLLSNLMTENVPLKKIFLAHINLFAG